MQPFRSRGYCGNGRFAGQTVPRSRKAQEEELDFSSPRGAEQSEGETRLLSLD